MELLTTKDVCETLHISTVTLWRMVKRGDMPKPIKFTETSPNLYKAEWLEQLIERKAAS